MAFPDTCVLDDLGMLLDQRWLCCPWAGLDENTLFMTMTFLKS